MADWLSFRAASVGDTLTMFKTLLNPFAYTMKGHRVTIYNYALAFLLTFGSFAAHFLNQKEVFKRGSVGLTCRVLRHACIICAVLICLERMQTFICFQF